MTLLTIAQAACNAVPIVCPPVIVGNTSDMSAQTILALANEAGEHLARRKPGGWTSMIREYNFQTVAIGPITALITTVSGTKVIRVDATTAAQISVYSWIASGTNIPNNAVVTAKAAVFPASSDVAITLSIEPTATASTGTFYFSQSDYSLPDDFARLVDQTSWDRTRYWQMRGAMTPQQWQFTRSSIFGKTTIQRRYRERNSDWLSTATGTPSVNVYSLDPVPLDDGANLVFEYVSNGWCANASTGARQSQWLADTDYGIIDEYLLTLGLKWRLLRRMGVSYQEELDEYTRELDNAVARDGGTSPLDMTPEFGSGLLTSWNTQEGNFPSGPVSS